MANASKPAYEMCIQAGSPEDCERTSTITRFERDARGLPWQVTVSDAQEDEERTTGFLWDADGTYVVRTTNPLGHQQISLMHPAFGVSILDVDENGTFTNASYDGFGRVIAVARDGSAPLTRTYAEISTSGGRGLQLFDSSTTGSQSYSWTDELGRTTEEGLLGSSGTWSVARKEYDAFGNVRRMSAPFVSGTTPVWNLSGYDRLGQQLWHSDPDGPPSISVPRILSTKTIDPENHVSYVLRDYAGRTIESGHHKAGTETPFGEVKFGYAAFDQVETTTDADQNVTSRSYDSFGRTQTARDPDIGSTSYKYDSFSQIAYEIRPLGTLQHRYDDLGRLVATEEPDGALTTRTYDEGPMALGKLSRAESSDGVVTELKYDSRGRPYSTGQVMGSILDSIVRRYDSLGRPLYVFYPVIGSYKFVIGYVYANGYLSEIRDVTSCNLSNAEDAPPTACVGVPLWKVDTRSVRGQPTKVTFGNSKVETREYEPVTGLTKRITTVGKDTSYTYDHDNLLETRTEAGGRSERFEYDELHRVHRWDLKTTPDKDKLQKDYGTVYDYDELGNLLQVTRNSLIKFSGTYDWHDRPHALGTSTQGSYTYDDNGRQYRAPGRTVTFNSVDLPTTIVQDGATRNFKYDGNGTRVLRTDANSRTRYLGGMFESRQVGPSSPATATFYVYGEGGLVAQVDVAGSAKTTRYVVNDPLGSASVYMSGVQAQDVAFYDPFGGRVNDEGAPIVDPDPSTTRGFTGHEDDGGGLVNMQGRIYDRNQYRFISPDPLIAKPMFGQAYNPYSYVYNNPLNFTDPSGFQAAPDGPVVDGPRDVSFKVAPAAPPVASEPETARESEAVYHGTDDDSVKDVKSGPIRATIIPEVAEAKPWKYPIPLSTGIARAVRTLFDLKQPESGEDDSIAWWIAHGPLFGAEGASSMAADALQTPAFAAINAGQQYGRAELAADAGDQETAFTARMAAVKSGAIALVTTALLLVPAALEARDAVAIADAAPEVTHLAERAHEIHRLLNPIARIMRTTAALETDAGTIIGAGGRDLAPIQRLALKATEIAAKAPGAHGEVTVIRQGTANGAQLRAMYATRDFCGACRQAIIDSGGTIIGPRSAIWLP
jgi:RHS repeat-associated protein